MDRFSQVFSNPRVVLPVIHVETQDQALRNVLIARDAGADGVFLINHGMPDANLLAIHASVATVHPDWWIGVNCLGLSPYEVFTKISPKVRGVWVDNAGINETQQDQPEPKRVLMAQHTLAPDCLYFGGVAFKYQRHVENLESACQLAARFMDVVTTSGPGTGEAADVEKIQRMKAALGPQPLAIASGITPENVGGYLPFADCYLVATGISKSFTDLDPDRVASLVDCVRGFEVPG